MLRLLAVFATVLLLCPGLHAQHLWWDLNGQHDATCLYGTITVLATHPAIYYCGANWHPGEPAGGYCGIQHNSEQERRTIFSIWDTAPQLHPKTTEADSDTVFGRFGGEGEGGHTHMVWRWKAGETFEFFVHKQRRADDKTTDARYYVFDRYSGGWRHVATINSPDGGQGSVTTIGGSIGSFLENYLGKDKDWPKVALYRLWLGRGVETMQPLTRAGGDGIWGQLNDSYFLAEGAPEKLEAVFRELAGTYGRPVFGRQGKDLPPISAKPVPADVTAALKSLPRAEAVQEQSDAPRAGATFIIRSVVSSKLLAVESVPGKDGSRVVQEPSSKSRIVWKLERSGRHYRIVNTKSGLVVDGVGSGTVVQRKPKGSRSQAWNFVKVGDAYQIQCQETGRVLDVPGGSTENRIAVISYPQNQPPSSNQLWILTEVSK
jgi:hypothetical protein